MENPELTSVWFRATVGTALSEYPVTFPELGVVVHVNNVPATLEVRVIFVDVLLQICLFGGELVRSGLETSVTT